MAGAAAHRVGLTNLLDNKRGSMQLLRITKVKDDVEDPTVSFSILIVSPLNADGTLRRVTNSM